MNTAFSGRGFGITTVVENYNGYDLINNVGTGLIGITKSSAINSSHLDMFGNRKYEEVTRYDESGNMGERISYRQIIEREYLKADGNIDRVAQLLGNASLVKTQSQILGYRGE